MLGNCEKMTAISSASIEWPKVHNHLIHENKSFMASTGMEKPSQDQQQQQQNQQAPLKCPRCDSTNTKFCYYNNYSLSQPRHFCKACKRYWTRGGTLRNVPVGGGCRKNKRFKRPAGGGSDVVVSSSSAQTATSTNPSLQPRIDLSNPGSNNVNPLFYGLPSNPLELNLPYPRFSSTRVSDPVSGFDIQPQMDGLGLEFSSGILGNQVQNGEYKNGFGSDKQIQDVITSSSLLTSDPVFGSSSFASTSAMASLLASSLQQQKIFSQTASSFPGFSTFQANQIHGNEGNSGVMANQVKAEHNQMNRFDNFSNADQQSQIENTDSSLLWNTSVSAWFDPNMGSSVPSLI